MEQWLNLLREGVTAAHTIAFVKNDLLENGFEELEIGQVWNLQKGG